MKKIFIALICLYLSTNPTSAAMRIDSIKNNSLQPIPETPTTVPVQVLREAPQVEKTTEDQVTTSIDELGPDLEREVFVQSENLWSVTIFVIVAFVFIGIGLYKIRKRFKYSP